MSKPSTELLETLHVELTKQLLLRVQSGEATAAELGAARQMLKDNGIEAIPASNSPLDDLSKSLPVYDQEDDDVPGSRIN